MNKKYDVCAIGNALIDYEIEVEDSFLLQNKIEKGLMTLVDSSFQQILITKTQGNIRKKQGGGSAANTIFALSQLGGKGFYTCKVANDGDGRLFMDDLKANKINANLELHTLEEGITGKCLVMITPDAQRTMNTFLGITNHFSSKELNFEAIQQSKYLFMEGFLVSSTSGLEAMKKAKKYAEKNNVKVSLTFSDPSMIKYFLPQMKEIVSGGIDLLFCNIQEAELFTGINGINANKEIFKKIAKTFVITQGDQGAWAFDGVKFSHIPPTPIKAIDSTGAGDMFAGAFLYAINQGQTFDQAGKLASIAAATIVGKYGPRFEKNQAEKILKNVNEQKTEI